MKKFILAMAMIVLAVVTPLARLASVASAQPPAKPLRVVLARQSTVDPVQVVRHFSQKCPNVTITTNPKGSDFMLNAGGVTGNYRFLVIAHGGDTIYATQTQMLSNAVKDVCNFLTLRAAN
jgi:hypothetical protein